MQAEKKTILIIDDDFYMRELAKMALSDIAQVVEADSAKDAVSLYKKHQPKMLLLDIHMPDMDGKNTLKTILGHDPNAYVVMLSSDSSVLNIKETNSIGAKGFVAKPFTKDSLLKYVRRCPDFK